MGNIIPRWEWRTFGSSFNGADEKIMAMAPESIHTMVVSGDVLIRATQPLQPIPEADVVCYGLWLDASVAKNHGVFVSSRQTPSVLKHMLQKPSVQTLGVNIQNAKDMHRPRSVIYFLVACVNVGVSILLIRRWGVTGTSLGTLGAMTLGAYSQE